MTSEAPQASSEEPPADAWLEAPDVRHISREIEDMRQRFIFHKDRPSADKAAALILFVNKKLWRRV